MSAKQQRILALPTEHGAYIILVAAWFWGIIFSPRIDFEGSILVLAVAITLFLSQESLRRRFRARTGRLHPLIVGFLVVAIAASVLLLIAAPSVVLILMPTVLLGLAYFAIARKKASPYVRSAIGFTLLSLIAPAAMLANNGAVTGNIFFVWLGVACFATSSVLVVGIRLDQPHAKQQAVWFHIMYIAVSLTLFLIANTPAGLFLLALLATTRFAIVLLTASTYRSLPLKTIGIVESILTVIGLLCTAFFRGGFVSL